ncbi:MAG: penicillin-binding protein [Solirubrobacterales bacterium]|jgi:penicillin-binding protein 1A|nr:penicillin-binding protein [Solirubrobacterales bacterium]
MDRPEDDSASGEGPRRRRRRSRSAEDRRAHKDARQAGKREKAERAIEKRERAMGGKPARRRRLLPAPPGPSDPEKRSRPRLRKLRFAFVVLGLIALAFVSWIFGIMMAVAQDLPSLESREQYKRAENSVVYDAYGNKLATLTNNQGRVFVSSDQISPVMKEAVVAIEDQRFYEHNGVDFQGIARAVWQDVTSGSAAQGASTITQQFVKNALAAQNSRTVFQKLREAALAYHLERQWSKDKILTEYLNEIYFGEGATGVEAAAKTYFGYAHPGCGEGANDSCASQLLPWEAALIAGVISSPSAYSPRNFPENATARRNQVLANMRDQGYITAEEYAQYSAQPIPTPKQISPPAENSAAPYFTSWLRQQLVDRYGSGEAFGGGLQIKSSLDLELQNRVQEIIASTLSGIPPTGSAVVIDNKSGAVLAMVGGSDYQNYPFNLATNGHRQPGSSFKPFTLITALEQGRSTGEVFASAPQQIPFRVKLPKNNGNGTKVVNDLFRVNNYNDSYLGSASIATATTYSDNSVYSQLGTQVGVQNVAATANAMGIDTDLSSTKGYEYSIEDGPWQPYNPALILGGLETGVTSLEMAHAYNTLAADGKRLSGTMAASSGGPVGILDVYDGNDCTAPPDCYQKGDPVPDETGASGVNELVAKQVIDPTVATTAKGILATVVSSGTGRRAQNSEPTWGKTGTTDDNGDAWFCGATPDITACVWVGYRDTVTPMETEFAGGPVDGGTFPAEIFSQIATAYAEVQADHKANSGSNVDSSTVPPTSDSSVAPAPTDTTATPAAPVQEAPAQPATPAAPAGGNGAPAAPTSGGGVSPSG